MKRNWFGLILLLLVSACNYQHEQQRCYHVLKGDFTEVISVKGTIKAEKSTFIKAPQLFGPIILWVEEDGRYVEGGDTVCILEHPETESRFESIAENVKNMDVRLKKLKSDHAVQLAMLQAEIENNNIEISIASLDSVQKKFAPPLQQKLIALQHQKANIRKAKLEKKFLARKTIGEAEIRSMKSRIKQQELMMQRMQDQLDQLVVTTPESGIFMRSENPSLLFRFSTGIGTLGGKVEEGASTYRDMNIAEIPNLDKMQILAELSETNYKKAQPGQQVNIRVEANGNLFTTGKVLRKMLTGKQHNRDSKVRFYEALIEVDSCHKLLTPGMNATCEIIISDYKDTIVVPSISLFKEDGDEYVYLLKGNKYIKNRVEIENTFSTYCIIASGLSGDSYIALSKPPIEKIMKEKVSKKTPGEYAIDTIRQDMPITDTVNIIHTNKIPQLCIIESTPTYQHMQPEYCSWYSFHVTGIADRRFRRRKLKKGPS